MNGESRLPVPVGGTPILGPEQRASAVERARELMSAVRCEPVDGFNLSRGAAGLAVSYTQFDDAFPGEGFAEDAARMLDQAVRALARKRMGASLYQGLTGVAWAIAQLGDSAGLERSRFLDSTIDRLLLEHVRRARAGWEFDLIDGVTGVGVYALERLDAPLGRDLLAAVVEALTSLAKPAFPGIVWESRIPRPNEPVKWVPYRHIGIAHGVPGPIALLAAAYAHGVVGEPARPLVDGAVEWLLSQELPEDGEQSRYAHGVGPNFAVRRADTYWCEGEPGIAAAMLVAARAFGDAGYYRAGVEIARRAATRSPQHTGIDDPCICHGAAGLALTFARMHALTGDLELLDAARRWADRTIEMAAPSNWSGNEIWARNSGLTIGRAGTALVLLTLAGAVQPSWDSVLLLGMPGVPEQF